MAAPERVIRFDETDDITGGLTEEQLKYTEEVLRRDGFAMVPSDSAYSIALLPRSQDVRMRLRSLTARPDEPVSVVFGSMAMVERLVPPPERARALLDAFSARGITVAYHPDLTSSQTRLVIKLGLGVEDGSIGVRISASKIERQLSRALNYPITTVPTRRGDPSTYLNFGLSLAYVSAESERHLPETWVAIEGEEKWNGLSTVVKVTPEGHLDKRREGPVTYREIDEFWRGSGWPL